MEDVLVGGSGRDEYTSDDDDDSLRSTRVTDYTEASRRTHDTHDSRLDEEEKKTNDSASVSVRISQSVPVG